MNHIDMRHMHKFDGFMVDGTFYVCPEPYEQLLVILAVKREGSVTKKVPILFALMLNKTE
jgi:hypothetical protein